MRVCALACGEAHCAAIGPDGVVYTWGSGAYGKLGHEGIPSNLPTLLDRLSLPGTNSQAVMYELIQRNGIGAVEETA